MGRKKDAYEKFAGTFKNEADFEEELEAEDLDPKKIETVHFEEEDGPAI
jgi:hypothetical protein